MMKIHFAAFVFLVSGSVGLGQVRTWVSPTGLDTNLCTRDQPCRSFNAAINAVAPGGEVVALESGGYGQVFISKSVTVLAPDGVHAAIAPVGNQAVQVIAASTDQIVLRNLFLNSQGAGVGIDVDELATLYVESCVVSGFTNQGILVDPTASASLLYVSDTVVRRSSLGIRVAPQGGSVKAVIDSVRLQENVTGIYVRRAEATIRETVADGNNLIHAGFVADDNSRVMIEGSLSGNSAYGFLASNGSVMTMTRSTATANNCGIRAELSAIIYVTDSTITENAIGIQIFAGGVVTSRGNNTLLANASNGTFTGSFTGN